jgi:RNA polymerase sigma-70 factor (ECF subfamily)
VHAEALLSAGLEDVRRPARSVSDLTVRRAQQGDAAAFGELYRTHAGRIHALCLRLEGDQTRAEELTQDVFVRAWEKLSLFRGESAFSTWLHRLAVNVVLHQRKSDGVRRARFTSDEDGEGTAASDAGALRQRTTGPGDRMDLEAAIAKLPPGARRVFTLHDVEGYKHEEIAEMLGVTSGATKAQLHRARLLLREALNR